MNLFYLVFSIFSLKIIGTLVQIEGEIEFFTNEVRGEGALSLLSFGQIRLKRGTDLWFEKNSGR